eukprot:gb/GECH01012009.1/.p1 GENE.gb/GECH01012009.1/~~gb/GECH01012009.1/.p1  ORF type:complete len:140 (+),score=20.84 gb/GECH01012009.1/:1-420(+)
MRHRCGRRRLGRDSAHRKALFRNQVTSLVKHDRIVTTLHKAKETRKFADRVVTWAKKGDLNAIRRMHGFIFEKEVARKALNDFPTRFAGRHGGYTRIIPIDQRRKGDGAQIAVLEYLGGMYARAEAESAEKSQSQESSS